MVNKFNRGAHSGEPANSMVQEYISLDGSERTKLTTARILMLREHKIVA
jgi:hypothetical protein